MRRIAWSAVALAALFWAHAAPARADSPARIKLNIAAQKEITVTDKDGTRRVELIEPKLVVPGEEVIYKITYTNVGTEPTTDVMVTNRIPEHMTYVRDSVQGTQADAVFSVDGTVYGPPDQLTVTTPQGDKRPATEQDFGYIRWVVKTAVPPGAGGSVSYRARLQ